MKSIENKIFELIDILKVTGAIRFKSQLCEATGMSKQQLYNIENGNSYFTPTHIQRIVKTYKVNANWIFGISDEIFLNTSSFKKPYKERKTANHNS